MDCLHPLNFQQKADVPGTPCLPLIFSRDMVWGPRNWQSAAVQRGLKSWIVFCRRFNV